MTFEIRFKPEKDDVIVAVPQRLLMMWENALNEMAAGVAVRLSSDADEMKEDGIETMKHYARQLSDSVRKIQVGEY